MEKKDILKEKSFNFSIKIVRLVQQLQNEKKEFVLSKQLLRSGTAIGALVSEAKFGQSDADFLSKKRKLKLIRIRNKFLTSNF